LSSKAVADVWKNESRNIDCGFYNKTFTNVSSCGVKDTRNTTIKYKTPQDENDCFKERQTNCCYIEDNNQKACILGGSNSVQDTEKVLKNDFSKVSCEYKPGPNGQEQHLIWTILGLIGSLVVFLFILALCVYRIKKYGCIRGSGIACLCKCLGECCCSCARGCYKDELERQRMAEEENARMRRLYY
jgi:hypothetical protein